jgi:bifunctional non-homologous end joining protein LigD
MRVVRVRARNGVDESRKIDRLARYREKRTPGGTPEPFGGGALRPCLFVVQKHAARQTHFDLRLEWAGTLLSWAVPHGISRDPEVKRLAVHVEDHPVDYADFEGIIPPGNYGAGAVIVWDRGLWIPFDDPDQFEATGKLHFELRGHKLRGVYTLIKTKRAANQWILFKKRDGKEVPGDSPALAETSILSGLTVEQLAAGETRAEAVRGRLREAQAPRRRVDPVKLDVMLAETGDAPFSREGWLFELKYDGYRMVAARGPDGTVRLRYRSGIDATEVFPDIASAVRALPYDLVLDGEAVALDEQGRPDFHRLQKRGRLQKRLEIERATVNLPATYFAFDLMGFEDFDLRGLPLASRKAILRELLPALGVVRYSDHIETRGAEMFAQVAKMGLEGIVAKEARSPYRGRRSGEWLKLPVEKSGDFVVCGWSAPQGSRAGFGALHLGAYDEGALTYIGSVGTGFDAKSIAALRRALEPLRQKTTPCGGAPPKGKDQTWVRPELVAEVGYKAITPDGLLRIPVFRRLRDDKAPEECLHPAPRALPDPAETLAALREERAAERTVQSTNVEKIFWPKERYTKGDLIDYYGAIAPWILPYLADRPIVLTRFPDGIDGKSFYQKNAPAFTPAWVRRAPIWSEGSERDVEYIVCDDATTLHYIANAASIPLHIWSSRVAAIQQPDWCILDLDPKEAPFRHVVELATAIRALCEDIELPCFVKTSGSTGLHVLIPLGGQCTYEQSRMLGHLLAQVIVAEHAEIATIARRFEQRGGKVYVDYLQNRHAQLLVAPFCVRPLPGAPVSTPLEWKEVNAKLDMAAWTIRTVPKRMEKRGEDPMRAVLTMRPDLAGALGRLAERIATGAPKKGARRGGTRKAAPRARPRREG